MQTIPAKPSSLCAIYILYLSKFTPFTVFNFQKYPHRTCLNLCMILQQHTPVFSWEIRGGISYFGKSSITSMLTTPTTWYFPLNSLTKMLHTFLSFHMNYICTNHTCSLYRVQIMKLCIPYFSAFSCYFFISTNITLIFVLIICACPYRVGKSFMPTILVLL